MSLDHILRQRIGTFSVNDPSNYYLAQIQNDGEIAIRLENFQPIGTAKNGISKPQIVRLNDGRVGFRKNSSAFDDSDDAEIVINYLGRCLGVSMAEEYRVFDRDMKKDSLLSIGVVQGQDETFFEMFEILIRIGDAVKEGKLPLLPWMNTWAQIIQNLAYPGVGSEYACRSVEDCRLAIELPLHLMALFSPDNACLAQFRTQYFRMILFDLFIGQKDRTPRNYGIILDTSGIYRLAPLFDNANLTKPYMPDNIFSLNFVALDRQQLLQTLLQDHAEEILPLIQEQLVLYETNGGAFESLAKLWIENYNRDLLCRNMKEDIQRKKHLLQ